MKIIISKILISICILTFLLSCSDQFLQDKRDYNNLTTLDVYSDPEQAKAVFGTIYKQILERYNSPFCGSDPLMRQAQNTGGLQHIYTEELSDGGFRDGRYNGSNGKNTKAGNHIANPPYWNDPRSSSSNYNNFNRYTLFPTVFLINNFIIEIDRSRDLYNNDTFWDQLKGQAIFARAWLYFDAVRLWGGVPIMRRTRISHNQAIVLCVCPFRIVLTKSAMISRQPQSCFRLCGMLIMMADLLLWQHWQ